MADGRPSDDLDEWVRSTAPRAIAFARSLLNHPADAEDVVQDCYCRLLAKADVYDLRADGLKLLMRSITNASINLRMRRKPMFRLVRETEAGEESDDPADATAHPPDAVAAGNELAVAVAAGLAQLPPQQRAAVELKALGHSQQEIAEILDVTPTNAGVLVYRARQTLARILGPFLPTDDEP